MLQESWIVVGENSVKLPNQSAIAIRVQEGRINGTNSPLFTHTLVDESLCFSPLTREYSPAHSLIVISPGAWRELCPLAVNQLFETARHFVHTPLLSPAFSLSQTRGHLGALLAISLCAGD